MNLVYDIVQPPGEKERNLPPVVLLHGMMDSRKTWKYVAPKIARNTGRKVYAVDARNHGSSPWSDQFNFDILGDDLYQFLECHSICKAVVVGHSMGGRTAMTLALKYPKKVEKLIVEDITPENFSPRATGLVVQMIQLMRESLKLIPSGVDETTAKKTIVSLMRELLPPGQMTTSRSIDFDMIPLRKDGNEYTWEANLDVLEDMLTSDKIRQELSGIYTGDALFLYGSKSVFKVETDELIPKFFPRSIKLRFEGASHLIHHEFPTEFERTVSQFINGESFPLSKY